ncbi:NUDIX domain-containing protein [Tenacibaculum sp. 190524A02b]|uniref:NUDIX domain-containing protein n=1 Tax=Tenacibaculum vairaonense TaxID=3137860 RepID=A0ABM9PHI5_9FLAO
MYKVFVNDKPIILTTSIKKEEEYPVFLFKNTVMDELIYKIKSDQLSGVYLFSFDLEEDWNKIKKIYEPIVAGGGLVLNSLEEVLFIYRGEKWDLPKGRIEEGEHIREAAVREVEEECGIENVVIKDFLLNTFHFFFQDGEVKLKETHWYLMESNYKGKLTPQLEEGITDVRFMNTSEIDKALQNTYANIKLVYESYLQES